MLVRANGLFGQVLVVGRRFTGQDGDKWTNRFNQFKRGEAPAVRAGVFTLVAALAELPVPNGPIMVLGVPGSADRALRLNSPVYYLAQGIAMRWRGTFNGTMIAKDPHDPIHNSTSAAKRNAVLDTANYRSTETHPNVRTFVIIDDLVTRGDTMTRIRQVIGGAHQEAQFVFIALAQTERLSYYREHNWPEPNNNEADKYEDVWTTNYR